MIARDTLIAGVLAATDKLVAHIGANDWQSAHKTAADRRMLLEQLAQQEPQPGEHDFVRALRDAAAESDAALRAMQHATHGAAPQR
jgi:hypothetical protein